MVHVNHIHLRAFFVTTLKMLLTFINPKRAGFILVKQLTSFHLLNQFVSVLKWFVCFVRCVSTWLA